MQKLAVSVLSIFLCGMANAVTCDANQYVDNNTCYTCPVNATCDGTHFICNAGFYKNGTVCSTCPVVNSTCTGPDNFSCNEGTYLNDAGQCAACPAHATCTGGDSFFHCDNGYHRNTTRNNTCESCDTRAICENGERIKCAPGYKYYEPYGYCLECNEIYCPDGEPIGCQEGYYWTGSSCYTCPSNYYCPFMESTSANYTQYCAPGYYHNQGVCVECSDDAECPGGKPENMTCSVGLYLHDDGRCLPYTPGPGIWPDCNPGYYDNGTQCATCPAGSTCTSATAFVCMTGFFKSGNTCQICPQNGTCNNTDGILCNPGYYLQNNQCIYCPNNRYCINNVRNECPKYVEGMYAKPELWTGDALYYDTYIAAPYPAYDVSQCMLYYGYIDSPIGKYVRLGARWNTELQKYTGGGVCWTDTVPGYYLSVARHCDGVLGYSYNQPCTNGPANSHYTAPGSPDGNDCPWICDDGHYRDGDQCHLCPDGLNCIGGRIICPIGMYADKNKCLDCPTGYGDNPIPGAKSVNECQIKCDGGSYLATAMATKCENVGAGYWAAESYVNYGDISARNACSDKMTTIGYGDGADEATDCGKIMHFGDYKIYLRSSKKTSPSLAVQYGDRVLYGNMSPDTSLSHIRTIVHDVLYAIY